MTIEKLTAFANKIIETDTAIFVKHPYERGRITPVHIVEFRGANFVLVESKRLYSSWTVKLEDIVTHYGKEKDVDDFLNEN